MSSQKTQELKSSLDDYISMISDAMLQKMMRDLFTPSTSANTNTGSVIKIPKIKRNKHEYKIKIEQEL